MWCHIICDVVFLIIYFIKIFNAASHFSALLIQRLWDFFQQDTLVLKVVWCILEIRKFSVSSYDINFRGTHSFFSPSLCKSHDISHWSIFLSLPHVLIASFSLFDLLFKNIMVTLDFNTVPIFIIYKLYIDI